MAKKSKKASSKKAKLSSLLAKINPSSPKQKLMTFIAVFAVLGGAYYAYYSFAATGTVRTYYASDFSSARGARTGTEGSGRSKFSVTSLVAPGPDGSVRISAKTRENYTGDHRACFHYSVPKQRNKPAKATLAFAVRDSASTGKALNAVAKEYSSTNGYRQECLSFTVSGNKRLELAVRARKGAVNFTKVTITPERSITIRGSEMTKFTSQMVGTRNIKQTGGNRNGSTVVEMYRPGSRILVGLKGKELNSRLKIQKGKKYKACITYSIGDKGSTSRLVSFYPVGTKKVDQQSYPTTKSLNTYTTKCHRFTYNEGNADAVSLHYPSWAQSLSSPYKMRIEQIKISQE